MFHTIEMDLKKTPLYQKHVANNARIVDFGGWALPLEYKSMLLEAKAVRDTCGLFDASHMGQIIVKGPGALEFLQRLTPNDISLIEEGQQQYNILLNDRGGVIDDLMVYRFHDHFFCVVNAANKDKVYAYLNEKKEGDVDITDESDDYALICLQGPRAASIMEKIAGIRASYLKYMHFIEQKKGDGRIIISRSGYTGEDGFEIYTSCGDALWWWDALIEHAGDTGVTFCGLGARDILRVEAGYSLYGHELDENINPFEAALGWVVKFNKDFIAKDLLLKVKQTGPSRRKIGFIMQEKAVARQDYPVYLNDEQIGKVSSGVYSPNLDKFIGMAYVDSKHVKVDSLIDISVRNKLHKAKIVKLPFLKLGTKK